MTPSLESFGRDYGRKLHHEIDFNLARFLAAARRRGLTERDLAGMARRAGAPDDTTARLVAAMAPAARVPEHVLMAYNLYGDTVVPEECTVVAAVGSRGAHGGTIVLKNSDKVGDPNDVGPGFLNGKEICVLLRLEQADKPTLIGVSAAGSVGVKMGINSRGVVAASNLARTREFSSAGLSTAQVRVTGRNLIMRRGLEAETAQAAATGTLHMLLASPMGTPGNVHFYDNSAGYIVEGSFGAVAVERVLDGQLGLRANRFQVMQDLNDPEDVSSHARYVRAGRLVRSQEKVDLALLQRISMDHENGPGPNSICRHSTDVTDEVTLGAAVMEVNPSDLGRSRIHAILGKPCHTWNHPQGAISMGLDESASAIPLPFTDGSGFKRFYNETPAL